MKNEEKFRTVTFRITCALYQKCVNKAIKQSVKTGKIVKVSELIREAIEKTVND